MGLDAGVLWGSGAPPSSGLQRFGGLVWFRGVQQEHFTLVLVGVFSKTPKDNIKTLNSKHDIPNTVMKP